MTRTNGRLGKSYVAVLTVVDEEFAAVRSAGSFQNHAGYKDWRYRNLLNGKFDVVLAQCAHRGNVSCGEAVRELFEQVRPDLIILSGIAGGCEGRDDVALGDVVVGDYVQYYELMKLVKNKYDQRFVPIDYPSDYFRQSLVKFLDEDDNWRQQILVERPVAGTPNVKFGHILTGEKLLADSKNVYQKKILAMFTKALAADMESYGFAREVFNVRDNTDYNLRYLILRGISDLTNQADNDDVRKRWRKYAAGCAASLTMRVVDRMLERSSVR
jgi:nucleoside phosphorylase